MRDLIQQFARQLSTSDLGPLAVWVTEQGQAIQQIPAPTFEEAARAEYMMAQFEALGLQQLETDDMKNVYGLLPGENADCPGLLVMAHIDTVFPAKTDLTLQEKSSTLHGPGLGDNSIGVAGILGLARFLLENNIRPACNLWFVATSREEGLGNLDGARLAYNTLRDRIGTVINVEGLAYGYVYHAGIAVRRLHITAHAQGGHSWLHFGRPSATHAIVRLGAAITNVRVPQSPRTTYNIGLIEGGHSINSIATEAGLWLDMRSEDTSALATLERNIRAEVARLETSEVRFEINVVGDRPAGSIDLAHPLIVGALAALEQTGVRGTLQIGSTDGNIPLADGCPTVTVGITRGGNAHRLDEFIEKDPIHQGMRHLAILALAAATYQSQLETTPS